MAFEKWGDPDAPLKVMEVVKVVAAEHAPALLDPPRIETIRSFLSG
jgi:hypothetical protein